MIFQWLTLLCELHLRHDGDYAFSGGFTAV